MADKTASGLNLVERAIAQVSPSWGLKRIKEKTLFAMAGGYNGASMSRAALRGWRPAVSDADSDAAADLTILRARSRDLMRNAPLAAGAINTMVTNVVGTGLSLQSRIDAKALGLTEDEADTWQAHTEREFRLWFESKDCDATRTQNGYGLQSLAFRSALESGDTFANLPTIKRQNSPYELAIQLVEADRVSNPDNKPDTATLVAGVELDAYGAPMAYHFCSRHPGGARLQKAAAWQRIEAFGSKTGRQKVIHLFDRRRPGQTRGVPILAPVIEPLKQLGRYTDAELQAAVVSGAFAVFMKMDPEAFADLFTDEARTNYLGAATAWDGTIQGGTMDGPGKAVNLLPGEEPVPVNPGRPNSEFDPFVQAIVRQVGVALELPFEVLIKHFTASYSAARAALLDAWRFFRGRRDWLASNFCQPIYELWLEEAVAIGRIQAPGFFTDPAIRKAWCGSVWVGDGPGSIDPLKEAQAAEKRIELEISTTATESLMHDGVPWEVKHAQRAKEVAARKRDSTDISGNPIIPIQPDPNNDNTDGQVNG